MNKWKRPLLLMAAVGLVAAGVGGGAGTFASFNATATANNVFSTGFLTVSTGNTGNVFITGTTTNLAPGDSVTGTITVSNGGTLPGELFLTGPSVNTCVDSQASSAGGAPTYTGTPSLCGHMTIALYEGTQGSATACFTGTLTTGTCAAETLTALASAETAANGATPTNNQNTLTGITIASLTASSGGTPSVTMGATVTMPNSSNSTNDNLYQNAKAVLASTFDLEQNS